MKPNITIVTVVNLAFFVSGNMVFPQENEDNTSKIPQYRFASTLEKQEEQLKDNPLLKRFAESRKFMSADPFRPG